MSFMKAVVFRGPNRIAVEERPRPEPRAGEAVIKVTRTSICATDVKIVKGEHEVPPGLILGHEPVGVIDALGDGLESEYEVGERVVVSAVTPCGQCFYCLKGAHSQCDGPTRGWRFGNTLDGAWAEYLRVPEARANLAVIPRELTDEDVLLVPDVFSTGMAGAEDGNVQAGDSVAIFGQGPVGLCATLGARLRGAGLIIAIDAVDTRLDISLRFGASVVVNSRGEDPVAAIQQLTGGRGVDVAIEALGRPDSFERARRSVCPGGTISSLGTYSGKLVAPHEAFYSGLGGQRIVTTLCPGGRERMRRLMSLIAHHRVDLSRLVTHRFALDDIEQAYELFAARRDGVLKVAMMPDVELARRRHVEASADAEC